LVPLESVSFFSCRGVDAGALPPGEFPADLYFFEARSSVGRDPVCSRAGYLPSSRSGFRSRIRSLGHSCCRGWMRISPREVATFQFPRRFSTRTSLTTQQPTELPTNGADERSLTITG